jgi:hypothetical protein
MSYQEFSVEFIEPEEFDDFSRTDTEDSDSVENMEDEELDVDIDNDGSRNSSSVSQAMCKNYLIFIIFVISII